MDTYETLLTRRSCRAYDPDRPVDRETLEKVVEAGRFAPSGMGRQPVHFVVVTDRATRDRLSRMNAAIMGSSAGPFYEAPAVIVVLVDDQVPTSQDDGALALGNLMNAAHALGVESCWIHRAEEEFDSAEGRELLSQWGLPADGSLRGIGHCILGYAPAGAPAPSAKPRKENVIWVD